MKPLFEKLQWVLVIAFVIMALLTGYVDLVRAEGNIAVNVAGVLDDNAWGVIGDYETQVNEAVKLGIEGNLQSGDAYAGNVNAAVTFLDYFRISSKNTLSGFSLDGLGRTNDLGASFVYGLTDEIDVAIGVFGRNGNPFEPVYELSNPTDPESVVLKDAGITIKGGSSVLASLETELDVGRFEVELQGLLEVIGEANTEKVQQVNANISTDGTVLNTGVTWNASMNIRAQKLGEVVEYETTYFAGFGKKF